MRKNFKDKTAIVIIAGKTYENDEIYENGRNYSNDDTPVRIYLFLAIFLI